jgi:hypothetical protein
VARGCKCDALAGEQNDAFRAFRREPGKGAPVGAGQPLSRGDPSRDVAAIGRRERVAINVRRIDRIDRPRQACPVDQHAAILLPRPADLRDFSQRYSVVRHGISEVLTSGGRRS